MRTAQALLVLLVITAACATSTPADPATEEHQATAAREHAPAAPARGHAPFGPAVANGEATARDLARIGAGNSGGVAYEVLAYRRADDTCVELRAANRSDRRCGVKDGPGALRAERLISGDVQVVVALVGDAADRLEIIFSSGVSVGLRELGESVPILDARLHHRPYHEGEANVMIMRALDDAGDELARAAP